MKTKFIIKFLILIITIFVLNSCGVLVFRKIECRDFQLKEELFWFQGKIKTSYVFVNEKTGEEKTFILKDKWISHRQKYSSDTGCDCHDKSSQFLIGNKDSIWTINDLRYIEKQEQKITEAVTIVFDGVKIIYNSIHSSINIKNEIINEIEIETKTFINSDSNSEIKLGKGVGLISIKISKNEIWKRKNITIEPISKIGDYRFMYNFCN